MGRRLWLAAAVLPAIVLLGACSSTSSGPLSGPGQGLKLTTGCTPAGPEGAVFSFLLHLRGDDAATITSIDVAGENIGEARALLDREGLERDEILGVREWPLGPDLTFGEAMMQRVIEPAGAVIEPGTSVSFLTIVDHENEELLTEVTRVSIGYDARDRSWTEVVDTRFSTGDCSALAQDASS